MNIVTALILIMSIIVIYLALISIFSLLFRVTGLTKSKAFFQTISLLTAVGFTTTESESITSDPVRRRLAIACMIIGNFFSIVIITLLINVISSFDLTEIEVYGVTLSIAFGVFVAVLIFFRLPFISKPLEDLIRKIGYGAYKKANGGNIITVLDTYGDDSIVSIVLHNVPKLLQDKTLAEAHIRNQYNVSIMAIKRKGKSVNITKDTMLQPGDQLIVYGAGQNINELFHHYNVEAAQEEEILKHNLSNSIFVVENYGETAMAEVTVRVVPDDLKDTTIYSSPLKSQFGINVMLIRRDNLPIEVNKDTVVLEGDVLVVFGVYSKINYVFNLNSVQK